MIGHALATPPGWGDDSLTDYLSTTQSNQWASFANLRPDVNGLIAIDSQFRKLFEEAANIEPLYPVLLFKRSYNTYRATCATAMAGQMLETAVLLRACLEAGGYAFYIGNDEKRWKCWAHRNDTEDAQKASKREFTHGNIRGCIAEVDSKLGGTYSDLYHKTIDFGAHPNPRGIFASTKMERSRDSMRILTIALTEDEKLYRDCFGFVRQVGICVLKLACEVYPMRAQLTTVKYWLQDHS